MPATSGPAADEPAAPTRLTRPKRGRLAQLSRDRIVAAALESNLDTLTVRELAGRLGVSHGALYRWVPSHQALADLVSEVIVDRILPADPPTARHWRDWLRRLAWSMHDEFLAAPAYSSRIARPHQHNPASLARLRDQVTAAFTAAGVSPAMAEQSWYIFGTTMVSWLAGTENSLGLGEAEPGFDLFLEALLRGLPAREP